MMDKTDIPNTEISTSTPVYLLALLVANFRCFGPEPQHLNLSIGEYPARWTVLLGENGVGKTTLLQACAYTLQAQIYSGITQVNSSLPPYGRFWHFAFPGSNSQTTFSAELHFGELGGPSKYKYKPNVWRNTHGDNWYAESPTWENVSVHTPFIGYGASRRMSQKSLAESLSKDSLITLFSESSELLNAEEWLIFADYATKTGTKSQKQRAKERYETIRKCLVGEGSQTGLLPDVEELRFTTTDDSAMTPRVEAKTPYGWVRVRDLSLGYQVALTWMIDFANRMFEQYSSSENPVAEPAICLVDEIDLHLHPRWQRELVRVLTETFPNTQFIVTAHSPLIVQAAPNANLALLRREGDHVVIVNDVDEIRNWSVGQILTSELFGLPSERPPQFEAKLNERAQLVAKKKRTAKERARLAELDAELNEMPIGENPAQIRALEFLERMASQRGQVK